MYNAIPIIMANMARGEGDMFCWLARKTPVKPIIKGIKINKLRRIVPKIRFNVVTKLLVKDMKARRLTWWIVTKHHAPMNKFRNCLLKKNTMMLLINSSGIFLATHFDSVQLRRFVPAGGRIVKVQLKKRRQHKARSVLWGLAFHFE